MTAARLFVLSCVALLGACGSAGGGEADTDEEETAASTGDPSTAVPPTTGSPQSTTADETSGGPSESSEASTDPTNPTDPTTDPTDPTESDTSPEPGAPVIPELQGECPEFVLGTGDNPAALSFPVGSGSRNALVWHDPAQGGGGPLVFFFHGGGGDSGDAIPTVSSDAIADIVANGGMVIAPVADAAAGTEWFLVSGSGAQNDMVMMDSMVACAVQDAGIDPYRIHGVGFSAGGLHVAMSSIFRSSYMASTVVYSGGVYGAPASQDANATPSSLIFHGGASDNVGGLAFSSSSRAYFDVLNERGGEAILCDHGTGHTYPPNETDVWRRRDAYNFLIDHPFDVEPHPYNAAGLPQWVPPYCAVESR